MTFLLRALGVFAALALNAPAQHLVPLEPGMVICRSGQPIQTITRNRPDDISDRASDDGVARELRIISDDGVRVWVDGAMILDEWAPHESKASRVPVVRGERHVKVEYYDVTGFPGLRFEIQRK